MTTTLRYDSQGSNIIVNNMPEKKVIRSYEDKAPSENKSGISFAKSVPAEDVHVEETTTEAPITRTERATQFRAARDAEKRAQQRLKEADEKFNQAQNFQQLMEKAKTDPTVIAQAMGMDPTEFLRKYQNQMFNIKDEPVVEPLKPEEEMKQRLDRYESERAQEKQTFQQMQVETIRKTYIANNILPVLDNEDFDLIHMQGSKEDMAGFIYDIMNDHYQKTGEEFSAQEVAEELENRLLADYEEKVKNVRKSKKLSKYFLPDEAEVAPQLGSGPEKNQISTKPAQLGTKTLSSSMENPNMSGSGTQRNSYLSREERIKRISSKF